MAFTDSKNRTTPNNWIIQTNDGSNVVAVNTITKETYNGTLTGFNTLINQSSPSFDVANANPVVLINPTTGAPYAAGEGGATVNRQTINTLYRVTTAFTGASINDFVTSTQIYDITGTPTLVSTIWFNQTTGLVLASAPSTANLEAVVNTGLTDAQLRAAPVPVSGTVTANTGLTQPLTDTQLRASAVAVSGPLTDTQLRASAVPVSGTVTANTGLSQPLTDAQLRASAVPVSGPLTDTQLRASALPVSGTVTANTGLSQPLTDTQLRASPVNVSPNLTKDKGAVDANTLRVVESSPASVTILNLTTNSTGTTWTAFTSQVCQSVDLTNDTGVTIEYRRNGAGSSMRIPSGSARLILGVSNANQIEVRRADTSNSQVVVQAEAFSF
jgi:hypothetical protein